MKTIGLIGNPNCGKTTIFNALTGARQHIGNWPGVTVEKKEGDACIAGVGPVKVVDLPGVYSLTATSLLPRETASFMSVPPTSMPQRHSVSARSAVFLSFSARDI